MGNKDKAPKPSRPYRGGHSGRGGSHEKGGCLAAILAIAAITPLGWTALEALRGLI